MSHMESEMVSMTKNWIHGVMVAYATCWVAINDILDPYENTGAQGSLKMDARSLCQKETGKKDKKKTRESTSL